MIKERIDPYYLLVQGFRSVRVVDSEKALEDLRSPFPEFEIQLLRADRVGGREHLFFAARNALASFMGKERRAKHLSMEFLLYASGQHQIIEAIKLLGVTNSTRELVLTVLAKADTDARKVIEMAEQITGGDLDDSVIEVASPAKIKELRGAYRISDKELVASRMPGEAENSVLKRLIIERSALLELEN